MNPYTFSPNDLPVLIPSILTIITCPYLFFKYLKSGWKRVGFSMIFLLTFSDFLYSLTVLSTLFFPLASLSNYYRFSFYFCSLFSIYWAAAIAFLVYKTLINKDPINLNKLFIKTLCIVLAAVLTFVFIIYPRRLLNISLILSVYAPLFSAIIIALIFYAKSIKLLRAQSEFERGSTTLYIRNLQYYCIAQFILYVPSMAFLWGMSGLLDFLKAQSHLEVTTYAEGLASLAGFVNAIIFLKQGNIKEYKTPEDQLHLDVDNDLTASILV